VVVEGEVLGEDEGHDLLLRVDRAVGGGRARPAESGPAR
jgi:hypothetical protein